MKLHVPGASDMERLGFSCGSHAVAGDVFVLTGELGAGKTTFARGFGEALGLETPVSSPTFIVARTHSRSEPSLPPLVHVDAYRLGQAAELDELDIDVAGSIVVAEWAKPYIHLLTDCFVEVSFTRQTGSCDVLDGDEPREVTLSAPGTATDLLARVMEASKEFHVSGS
jgi:tRNA threonylcarbamoyl adenosine modification protein YjeE